MATKSPAEMTMEIMHELMDDALLVSNDDVRLGILHLFRHMRNLEEGSGAASLAVALMYRGELFERNKVVGILEWGQP